jgi:hypothetical protein
MPETTPDDDLQTAIAQALAQMGYDPPSKSNPAERALYFRAAAPAIRQHLAHAWVVMRQQPLQPAPSMWKPGDRTPEEQ